MSAPVRLSGIARSIHTLERLLSAEPVIRRVDYLMPRYTAPKVWVSDSGSTFRERARNGFLRSFSTVYHFPPAAIDGWYFGGVRLFTSCARTG